MLELFKQGLVELDQADRFGEIAIEWTGDADAGRRGDRRRRLRRMTLTTDDDDDRRCLDTPSTCGRSRRSSSSPTSRCRPSCWPSCSSGRSTDIERWCHELAAGYEAEGRGFQLVRVAGGYRYQTHPDLAPYVERFLLHDQRARLSGAALETLAIVAYKQPISRAQIASIRGVDPDGVLRTLQGRGYIDAVGRDPGPGQAVLYGTTPSFLEKLGLDSRRRPAADRRVHPRCRRGRGARGRAAGHAMP